MNADQFLIRVALLDAIPKLPDGMTLDIKKLGDNKIGITVCLKRNGKEYYSYPQIRPSSMISDDRILSVMRRAIAMAREELSVKVKDDSLRANQEDFNLGIF